MAEAAPAAKRKPTKPRGLGTDGARVWREIITSGKYELRPDEVELVRHICHEEDIIATFQADVKYADAMVEGSQGQHVRNPVFDMIAQHRTLVNTLYKTLKLPDEEPGEKTAENPRSVGARAAANSRWGNGG